MLLKEKNETKRNEKPKPKYSICDWNKKKTQIKPNKTQKGLYAIKRKMKRKEIETQKKVDMW